MCGYGGRIVPDRGNSSAKGAEQKPAFGRLRIPKAAASGNDAETTGLLGSWSAVSLLCDAGNIGAFRAK